MAHKKLHPRQQQAVNRLWERGCLTPIQKKIIQVLDQYFDDFQDGITVDEIRVLANVSYGAAWTALGVLDSLRYVTIPKDHKGRALHRGLIFLHGLGLSEGWSDD